MILLRSLCGFQCGNSLWAAWCLHKSPAETNRNEAAVCPTSSVEAGLIFTPCGDITWLTGPHVQAQTTLFPLHSTPPSLPLPSPVCPHFHSQMSPSPLLHRGPSEMPSPKQTTLEPLTSDRPLRLCLLTLLFFLTFQLLKLIYYTMLWQLLHKPTDFSWVVHRSILRSWIVPAQLTLSKHLLRKNWESRCCSMESRKKPLQTY